MTDIAFFLAATFAAGLLMSLVKLPALLGFLLAGFLLEGAGVRELPYLDFIAELGVTLLLFGIGLKLDLRSLLGREVWVTTGAHVALSVAIGTGFLWLLALLGFPLLGDADIGTMALIAFALSFSSTVFVVKVLEDKAELQSFYGRVAIGILVMQDLAAVIFMTASKGEAQPVGDPAPAVPVAPGLGRAAGLATGPARRDAGALRPGDGAGARVCRLRRGRSQG